MGPETKKKSTLTYNWRSKRRLTSTNLMYFTAILHFLKSQFLPLQTTNSGLMMWAFVLADQE